MTTMTSTTSDTASFTDPIFLATYGLNRVTVLDYFLHPLNPFRTKSRCCNDILISQQISIGFIMQNGIGMRPGPLNLLQAEEEFNNALKRMRGEQYELLSTTTVAGMQQPAAAGSPTTAATTTTNPTSTATTTTNVPHELEQIYSPLFTIRHIYRSSETKVTPLGIYYVLEGIIYKSPTARSLMKASIARTTQGLIDACDTLRQCQRYNPRTGYYWDFEETAAQLHPSTTTTMEAANNAHVNALDHDNYNEDIVNDEQTIADLLQEYKEQVNRIDEIEDNRNRGAQRSEEEEQGIRAREKINSILLGLPKLQLPS